MGTKLTKKTCSKCDEVKTFDQFYKNRTKKFGVCSECKECTNKANKLYVQKNKQKYLNYQKKYHQEHREQHRDQNLKQNYGISSKHWQKLFNSQKGCCAACGVHQSKLRRTLDTDHNHDTGEIRGLLCSRCNVLIGYAEEDIVLLKILVRYLEEHNGD